MYRGLSTARGVILATAASVVTFLWLLLVLPWHWVLAIWAACSIVLLLLMTIAASRIPSKREKGLTKTMPMPEASREDIESAVREHTRSVCCTRREVIEQEIRERMRG